MDPSSGQHQQIIMSSHHQSLENMITCSKEQQQQQEKKARPQPEQALKCPRCDSTNTKFCYYNNYSLSQPRYFCKSCRRYWTKGGTLRNVPVGGGCRKNKRSSSSSSTPTATTSTSSSSSSKRGQDHHQGLFTPNSNPLSGLLFPHPHLSYDSPSSDLTLALARLQKQTSCGGGLGFDDHDLSILGNPTSSLCGILGSHHHNNNNNSTNINGGGFLEALRSGFHQGTQNNNNNHHQNNNLFCSYGNGDMGEVVDNNNGNSSYGEMMVAPNSYDDEMSNNAATQAVSVTTMKQELLCSGGSREQQHMMMMGSSTERVFGGIPWHHLNGSNNGDTNMMLGELDSAAARASWNNNGFTSSNWQGLLHSPLM